MTDLTLSTCPHCRLKNRLKETILSGGSIKYECKSCGYFTVWLPRMDKEDMRRANSETRTSYSS